MATLSAVLTAADPPSPGEEAPSAAPPESPSAETGFTDEQLLRTAIEVKTFGFEREEDLNYDGIPDHWSRRKGPGFPHYLNLQIDSQAAARGRSSLRIDANGGQAAFYSPPIPVDDRHSFMLEAAVRTEGLKHNAAVVSISFLDHRRVRVQRLLTRAVSGTHAQWQHVWLGPLDPLDGVRFAVIGCHLAHADNADVRGSAWFDELRIASLPRITLQTSAPLNLFRTDEPMRIDCTVRGLDAGQKYSLVQTLRDMTGAIVVRREVDLEVRTAETGDARAGSSRFQPAAALGAVHGETRAGASEAPADGGPAAIQAAPAAPATPNGSDPLRGNGAGAAGRPRTEANSPGVWELPPQPPGLYSVEGVLKRNDKIFLYRRQSCAVLEAAPPSDEQGEFGWSFPNRPSSLDMDQLAHLASEAGLSWIKYPVWSVLEGESIRSLEVTRLLEAAEKRNITVVGMLSDPPEVLRSRFASNWVGVSKIFSLPGDRWFPTVEPIAARYSFHIRQWQLGGDFDDSFVGMEAFGPLMGQVRGQLDRVGRDMQLVIPWTHGKPLPAADSAVHFAVVSPSGSEAEWGFDDRDRGRIWITLQPLPTTQPLEQRIQDLVRRMVLAHRHRLARIFLSDPLAESSGVLSPDGSPEGLFIPWRTTAAALRGKTFAGELRLLHSSRAFVFTDEDSPSGEAVVVLWNDQLVEEPLHLGDRAELVDVWGRRTSLARDAQAGHPRVAVGPMPTIVRNASRGLVLWQLAMNFERGELSSEYGGHPEALIGENTFSQGVSGTATLRLPAEWRVEPSSWSFNLAAGDPLRLPALVTLPPNTSLGRFLIAIDVELAAERPYRFTVYRPYRVGLGDVTIEVRTRKMPDGTLEIEQQIVNSTQPLELLNLDCTLSIPGVKRQRRTVINLGKGTDTKFYEFPGADDLAGREAWIRCEQSNGRRVLNHRWKIEF